MPQPFNDIAPQYDLLNDILSLGLHRVWKSRLVSSLLAYEPHPEQVLDIATGTGDVAALFAEKLDPKKVFAIDPCLPMMQKGQIKYPFLMHWKVGHAERLPYPTASVSITTCTFGVRNFENRTLAFQEIGRVLKPGGLLGVLEIHPISRHPRFFLLRWCWDHVIPFLGGLFKKKAAYQYLRDTGAGFISAKDMVKELAPYFKVKVHRSLLPGGLVSFLILERK